MTQLIDKCWCAILGSYIFHRKLWGDWVQELWDVLYMFHDDVPLFLAFALNSCRCRYRKDLPECQQHISARLLLMWAASWTLWQLQWTNSTCLPGLVFVHFISSAHLFGPSVRKLWVKHILPISIKHFSWSTVITAISEKEKSLSL